VKVLRLEIGEVAVRGLGALDGERVRTAAARELERLLAADAAWPRAYESRVRVDAGRVSLPSSASADDVGAAIGRAVRRGLA
jgi:hypothetical protein